MSTAAAQERPLLLLVDDDASFRQAMSWALTGRGYRVLSAADAERALTLARHAAPQYAVVDLRMPETTGLAIVPRLKALNAEMRIVMLTGYASIATAVEAIKLGATHYLAKPVDADDIVAAFAKQAGDAAVAPSSTPLSIAALEWEHIQKVLVENRGNISLTARKLNMPRRTLQRKLARGPRREEPSGGSEIG